MEARAEKSRAGRHSISLVGRERMTVCGARDVQSFDESGIVLLTDMGVLSIEGEGLRIVSFSSPPTAPADGRIKLVYDGSAGAGELGDGVIEIVGRVDALAYISEDGEEVGGFFRFLRRRRQ